MKLDRAHLATWFHIILSARNVTVQLQGGCMYNSSQGGYTLVWGIWALCAILTLSPFYKLSFRSPPRPLFSHINMILSNDIILRDLGTNFIYLHIFIFFRKYSSLGACSQFKCTARPGAARVGQELKNNTVPAYSRCKNETQQMRCTT